MPVDAVLLNLHGAMVADGYDDCEGDILARFQVLPLGHVALKALLGAIPAVGVRPEDRLAERHAEGPPRLYAADDGRLI